jgi:hypothetical protein
MINFRRKSIIVLLIVSLSLSSCLGQQTVSTQLSQADQPKIPDIGLPETEMNSRIIAFVPKGWNSFKTSDIVMLSVRVLTKEMIAFTQDMDANLFILKDNQWLKIGNSMGYNQRYVIVDPAGNGDYEDGSVGVSPEIPNPKIATTLLIIITGRIYKEGKITDHKTAAYVIVNLKP